jgi:predicted Ser/Thr protein kinase
MDREANEALEQTAESRRLPATQAMPVAARPPSGAPAAAPANTDGEIADAADGTEATGAADAAARAIVAGGRYRIEGLLGEGGMGRVYRAHDNQLDRTVAIKVLAASGAGSAARLEREAQLQARVEHPNVAKVYETGETRGIRFIVMQFVPGRPLAELSARMSLEQKVRVVQRVAEGIHEAHRLGLVHGDIKPGNVLVVEESTGAWHPYVLDFGIAREIEAPGAAAGSAVAGTPAYMAPEQAQRGTLDRRSDVYSLGVTLYRLLSGKLPISRKRAHETPAPDDPVPLRKVAPQVAPDLEAIVMKCLEQAPGQRYATARALADDLVRFLDGEPVLARRQTLLYRLGRKARKNRALVGVSAAALIGVLVAAGWGVHERLQTARRAAIAQRFGREEERFEWTLRAVYELPLHDTTRERGAVRSAIEGLSVEVEGLSPAMRAPGDAAIGRGYLALGDEAAARTHLERAWRDGYREPEVAYALGLTVVHAYQEALARARLARDDAERRLALDAANRRLRQPALAYLRSSRSDKLVASEYLEGLLAYLEGNTAVALQRSRQAIARLPWLYEALVLEAQAWRADADQARDEAGRSAALARAAAALQLAARLGESDPRTYLGLCETEIERLQTAIYGSGEGVAAAGARATDACGAALRAESQNAPALARATEALTLQAGFELDHGVDPEPRLRTAEAAARQAIRLRGEQAEPYRALAGVFSLRARALRMHGGDPRQALIPAIANLDQALLRDPNDWQSLAVLGSALGQRGVQEYEHGEDAAKSFQASAAALLRSAALEPRLYTTYFNLGHTYGDWGEFLAGTGKDQTAVQDRAIAAYHQAIAIKPDYAQAYNSLGAVLNIRGSQPRHGVDPQAVLASAEAAFKKAIAIQPSYANPRFNLGVAYREMGRLDDQSGRDPWPHLRQAIAAFQEGLRLNPSIFFAYIEMGRIYVVGGAYDVRRHRSPEDASRDAVRLADKSLAMQAGDYMALKTRGEARLLSAQWALEQRRSPDAPLAQALLDFEQAAKANTNDFGVYELLGQVSLIAAKHRLATGQPVEPQIELGLRRLGEGRKVAGEEEAGLLEVQGELHLVQAQAARDAGARAGAGQRAVAAFEAAARLRPSSAPMFAPSLAQAKRMAGGPIQGTVR